MNIRHSEREGERASERERWRMTFSECHCKNAEINTGECSDTKAGGKTVDRPARPMTATLRSWASRSSRAARIKANVILIAISLQVLKFRPVRPPIYTFGQTTNLLLIEDRDLESRRSTYVGQTLIQPQTTPNSGNQMIRACWLRGVSRWSFISLTLLIFIKDISKIVVLKWKVQVLGTQC